MRRKSFISHLEMSISTKLWIDINCDASRTVGAGEAGTDLLSAEAVAWGPLKGTVQGLPPMI
jgi:hypothetical protein